MFYLNDDSKKKLKEKMGAAVSDEELENVAGGTTAENAELLGVLKDFHPKAVEATFKMATFAGDDRTIGIMFESAVPGILKEVLGNRVTITPSINGKNKYTFDGKEVSHAEMKKIIQQEGWAVS